MIQSAESGLYLPPEQVIVNSGLDSAAQINSMQDLGKELKSSFLSFTKYFYYLRSGRSRKFVIPPVISRESHYITIAKALTRLFKLEIDYLMINVPPRHGKSTFLQFFVPWCYAWYADCNFLYISYGHELASQHTHSIKQIMDLPEYRELFNVELRKDSQAKDSFMTTSGGKVKAFGSSGAVTGQDAGLPYMNRFSGCTLIDDFHKPDDVHSDLKRSNAKRNYDETIKPRKAGPNIPTLAIGHMLHQDDVYAAMLNGDFGEKWERIMLPALNEHDQALCPSIISAEELIKMRQISPYKYWSQYQQTPQPPGGSLFDEENFPILEIMPNIVCTFITVDTAETDKTINDATVFSLWGLYKVENNGFVTDEYALHWLACDEIWVEPKDLQSSFMSFYGRAMTFNVKPKYIVIEKKSTGTTLSSVLNSLQGISVLPLERSGYINGVANSKTNRFLASQPYIASKLITLPYGAKHTKPCIDHMVKITNNQTHMRDDIADTCADAIRSALIDKVIISIQTRNNDAQQRNSAFMQSMANQSQQAQKARGDLWKQNRF